MNVAQLAARLEAEGVRSHAYSLKGGTYPFEWAGQYCMEHMGDGWHAFFAEKGRRLNEQVFSYEDQACQYFLEWILADPATR